MITSQTELIEQELVRMGFRKVDETVREQAARILTGEIVLNQMADDENFGEIKNLMIYRETKLYSFLHHDFDVLSVQDKLKWLRNTVETPRSDFQKLNFMMAFYGRGGFLVSALFKAYSDKNEEVKAYAGQMLEKILLSDNSPRITSNNVKQYVDEMSLVLQIPQPYAITEEQLKGTGTTLRSFLFNVGGNIYVMSYRKNGKLMHTLIDTGERRFKHVIMKLIKNNGIRAG